jgi:Tfp pilus assembly PilM family ATPase
MIKNIFLPEKWGTYYLFPKRILSFDLSRSEIYACLIHAQGETRTIQALYRESLENNSELAHEEKTINAIRTILARIGQYDSIYIALPSSNIIFKELTLPFSSIQKIKLVLPFEIESLLPFSLDQAVIDAIITRTHSNGSTDVLSAAVKREYIEEQLRIFEAAGAQIDKITVDMFELYGLYSQLPFYDKYTGTTALIDIGNHVTRIALIIEKQLKYIRVIPRGVNTIIKKIKTDLPQQTEQESDIYNYLMRFGVDQNDNLEFSKYAQTALRELVNEINFTITTYTSKLKNTEQLSHITLTGEGSEILGVVTQFEHIMQVSSDILDSKKIFYNQLIKSDITHIPNGFLISIATALSPLSTAHFNLQNIQPIAQAERELNRQIITIGALVLLIISSFIMYSFIRTRSMRKMYNNSQKEAIDKLKKSFNIPEKSAKNIKSALNASQQKLADLKRKWSPLSHKNSFSFLKFLYELSRNINKNDIDLDLSSITLDQDEIVLKGKVKNVEALRQLENQLKSEYFTLEESPQTPDFKQKPIKLKIKDQRDF